jgi:hypothetical protein
MFQVFFLSCSSKPYDFSVFRVHITKIMILFMAYIAMVIDLTTILFKPHPLIQNKVKLQIRGFLCLQNLVFLFW